MNKIPACRLRIPTGISDHEPELLTGIQKQAAVHRLYKGYSPQRGEHPYRFFSDERMRSYFTIFINYSLTRKITVIA